MVVVQAKVGVNPATNGQGHVAAVMASPSMTRAGRIAEIRRTNLLDGAREKGITLTNEQVSKAAETGEWPWAKPKEQAPVAAKTNGANGNASMTARDMTIEYYNKNGWGDAKPASEGLMK